MPLPFILAAFSAISTALGIGATGTAAVAAGIATAGATTIGTVTAGAGLILGGLVITAGIAAKLDECETIGFKKGQESASREYEKKLQDQAKAFLEQLKRKKEENSKMTQDKDEALEIAKKAMSLYGELRGVIGKQGYTPEKATIESCANIEKFIEQNHLRQAA